MAVQPAELHEQTMDVLKAGIKAVAVGVSGSKPIPAELTPALCAAVRNVDSGKLTHHTVQERLASFLGTLFVKHNIADTDKEVLAEVARLRPELEGSSSRRRGGCNSHQILSVAKGSFAASTEIEELAQRLLDAEFLEESAASRLGSRLLDPEESRSLRTLCAHVLRVRYEAPQEWRGLLAAQQETVAPAFRPDTFKGRPGRKTVQIAEPFDGVNRSWLLTPLLAKHLQERHNCLALSHCGETAGPKYGPNLHAVGEALGGAFARSNQDVAEQEPPEFGWYIDQKDACPALDNWVELRRNIIKRPFLATTEKLLDTSNADVLIASAFHPSFSDKMFDVLDTASKFRACIIVHKGAEGSLGLGLGKKAKFSCGVRQSDGRLERHDFSFGAMDAGLQTEMDLPLEGVDVPSTVQRLQSYALSGASGDESFDHRVQLTLAGFDQALAWVLPRLI